MLTLVSFNIKSLFGKGKRSAPAETIMVSAESAETASHMRETDIKIEHLADAVKGVVAGQKELVVSLGTRFEQLHGCIDRANADNKAGRAELKADLKADLKSISERLDTRDNILDGKIDECRTEKILRAVK